MTYNIDLKGKTALVTAAGQGIGLASVKAFANAGARVIATDINKASLAALEQIPNITARQLDVTNSDSVASVFNDVGTLDVLFNCAGFVHAGSILECSEEDWDFAFTLNTKAMYQLCKLVLPGMIKTMADPSSICPRLLLR